MRRLFYLPVLLAIGYLAYGQDDTQILDLKMQLLESKMQLLDSKMESWGSNSDDLNAKLQMIDSILQVLETELKPNPKDDISIQTDYKTAVKLDPARLFEGTFLLSYERRINPRLSVEISGLGTYVTRNGLGGGYLKLQSFSSYDLESNSYTPYYGRMLTGWGSIIRVKNYLSYKFNPDIKAPTGLYAASQLMYRKIWIKGNSYNVFYEPEEVTQNLDIFSGGVLLGGKFVFLKVLCIDIYAGGVMRLSRYTDEDSFTKFKKWYNIDYSGVLPTAGINVGILK